MNNKKIRRYLRAFLLAVVVVCLALTGREYALSVRHKTQKEALIKKLETVDNVEDGKHIKEMTDSGQSGEKAADDAADSSEMEMDADDLDQTGPAAADSGAMDAGDLDKTEMAAADKAVILKKYAGLYEENKDLAGWLLVEGTKIDYPVMQREDDEYYLHRDFYGQESKYGCLYMRSRADIENGTNFIIYGHNMKDGSMFGELDLYLEEAFYREHPFVCFDSLYEERTYEIIAVFLSQVFDEDEDVFLYYQFYEADTEEKFDDFYQNIKALSLYDTGVEARFGDQFITLSTCAYHVEDGRLVVVAKRLKEGL